MNGIYLQFICAQNIVSVQSWYGITCSGQVLFNQDIANDELIDDADKTRLCTWLVISDDELASVECDEVGRASST